jgi:hypothetical protein
MINVYKINILKPKYKSQSHWKKFPVAYFAFIKRLLYLFKLYIDIHNVIHDNHRDYSCSKDSIRKLKQYIQYMDGVIMEAWEQCCAAAVADELGPDWRCPALNKWLCLELHGTDRTEYETSVPDWHHGEKYNYEITLMKEEDLRGTM